MAPFTLYDYVSFMIPGGVILFTAFFGWFGWPYPEPGATALVGILGASLVVGQLNAGLAAWLAPLFLGGVPGRRVPSDWHLFSTETKRRWYSIDETKAVKDAFKEQFGDIDFQSAYNLGYTRLQHEQLDQPVVIFNAQTAFCRHTCSAALVSLGIVIGYATLARSHHHLPIMPWAVIYGLSALLLILRFRWLWIRTADNVIRGVRTLPPETAA